MTFRSNFRRNTSTTGRVVDTGPTTRTNTGLTGLGAVGGPRGVGAGALRVLVEFLATYDDEALGRLEADLGTLKKSEADLQRERANGLRQRNAAAAALTKISNLEQSLTRGQNKLLKETIELEKRRAQQRALAARSPTGSPERAGALQAAREIQAQINKNVEALRTATGLADKDINTLLKSQTKVAAAQERQAVGAARVKAADQGLLAIAEERLATEQAIAIQRGKVGVAVGKIGSLALGALGGLAGGAAVGIGFAAVQAVLDQLGSALTDVIAPAKAAQQALDDVGDSILGLAKSEGLTTLQATNKFLSDIPRVLGGQVNEDLLAQAVALKQVNDALKEYQDLTKAASAVEAERREALKRAVDILFQQGAIDHIILNDLRRLIETGEDVTRAGELSEAQQQALALANKLVADTARDAASGADAAAAAENRLGGAAAFAKVQQEALASALDAAKARTIGGLEEQIANIPQVSPRTTGIENQINALQEAAQAASVAQQLGDIDMQTGNILLEQRLSLLNKTVNIEQYSGEQRLIAIQHNIELLQEATFAEEQQIAAIDDEIKALQRANREIEKRERLQLTAIDKQIDAIKKEQAAADKANEDLLAGYDKRIEALQDQIDALDAVNNLLDLQYRASQTLKRQSGESIGDFLGRRAQENREILTEFAKLRLKQQIDEIQGEKEKAQAAIDAENERREAILERLQAQKDALEEAIKIRREEYQLHLEALQDERERLQAILERHQKARQAAIKALQEEAQRTQREIQLRQLAERRKQILVEETRRKTIAALQEALRKSQEADKKAADSKEAQLRRQIAATEKAYKAMAGFQGTTQAAELRSAIAFSKTLEQLRASSGGIAGALSAKNLLEAKILSGEISRFEAAPLLRTLTALIDAYYAKKNQLINEGLNNPIIRNPIPFQHGGIIDLTNASSLFGSNVRTGEAGPELGVVLSNRVVQALREERPKLGDQTFIINRSNDPWLDKTRFRTAVRDAMRAEL